MMTTLRILLLMILAHVIDDFVFQPICLSKLKQREWWKKNAPDKMYAKDYIAALIIHSVSWSIMTLLPIIFFTQAPDGFIMTMFVFNAVAHAVIDDAKANRKEINLGKDQLIHLIQIVMTWIFYIL